MFERLPKADFSHNLRDSADGTKKPVISEHLHAPTGTLEDAAKSGKSHEALLADAKNVVSQYHLDSMDYATTIADRAKLDKQVTARALALGKLMGVDPLDIGTDVDLQERLGKYRTDLIDSTALTRFPDLVAKTGEPKPSKRAMAGVRQNRQIRANLLGMDDVAFADIDKSWKYYQAEQMQRELDAMKDKAYHENRHYDELASGRVMGAKAEIIALDKPRGGKLGRLLGMPLPRDIKPSKASAPGDYALRIARQFDEVMSAPKAQKHRETTVARGVAAGMSQAEAEDAADVGYARLAFDNHLSNRLTTEYLARGMTSAEIAKQLDQDRSDMTDLMTDKELRGKYQTYRHRRLIVDRHETRDDRIDTMLNGRSLEQYALDEESERNKLSRKGTATRKLFGRLGMSLFEKATLPNRGRFPDFNPIDGSITTVGRIQGLRRIADQSGSDIFRAYRAAIIAERNTPGLERERHRTFGQLLAAGTLALYAAGRSISSEVKNQGVDGWRKVRANRKKAK